MRIIQTPAKGLLTITAAVLLGVVVLIVGQPFDLQSADGALIFPHYIANRVDDFQGRPIFASCAEHKVRGVFSSVSEALADPMR